MSSNLLSLLRIEERQLLAELRATPIFQKLEAVRRVVSLYTGGAAGVDDAQAVELLLVAGGASGGGAGGEGRIGADALLPADLGPAAVPAMAPAPLREPLLREMSAPAMVAAAPAALAPRAEELPPLPPSSAAPRGGGSASPPPAAAMAFAAAKAAAAPRPAALAQPAVAMIAEPGPGESLRDGSKAVSAVRAALLAVTR